jgi:hypothetical protein
MNIDNWEDSTTRIRLNTIKAHMYVFKKTNGKQRHLKTTHCFTYIWMIQ